VKLIAVTLAAALAVSSAPTQPPPALTGFELKERRHTRA
jgi:hypothetical protein